MLLLEYIINFVAPSDCAGCGKEGAPLCLACVQGLPLVAISCYRCAQDSRHGVCSSCAQISGLDALFAGAAYTGVAKKVVYKFKFARMAALAAHMASAMADAVPKGDYTVVSYVPTATSRVRARGYDQARLVAVKLAKQLGLPCLNLLSRDGQQRQVGKQRGQRLKQASQAYRVLKTGILPGQRVLLVDDVLTTGATLEAAATTLRSAGAKAVYGVVFARVTRSLEKASTSAIITSVTEG